MEIFSFDAPQRAIATLVQTWIQDHPIVAWSLTHPLLSGGGLLIAVVLVRGLLGAIARLTERIWLALLRAPVLLASWLLGAIANIFRQPVELPTLTEPPNPKQRLLDILDRLEALKQEQDALLQEVRAMLGTEQL
ncbi:MAG: hypothetical protein NW220_08385 [Leptolyngbyaceae cyanobacterium bins.349]|nr:hypothetical protein [Leptolyngbyaceae cyanobacterium bins.349]